MKIKKAYHSAIGRKNSTFYIFHSAFFSGFTLIELLVVISIIAILAGMVMPMFYSAKERAREAKAKVEVKALETALKSYLDTYKTWPSWADGKIEGPIFTVLRGDNSSDNPQGIAFYEFGSTNSTETKAYDPWANPSDLPAVRDTHVYQVMFDKTYDNKIDSMPDVYRSVVVYSLGKDLADSGDDVASWK